MTREHPHLLVGPGTRDDAGVYRLTDDTALVLTLDFIPPPVDDAVLYGEIAAANSLSDIYAMGARPLVALNIVGFPDGTLDETVLQGILEGGLHKIEEAGAALGGGHTVRDREPKYGLSVTGVVHPAKMWRNTGARPGDVLILTKALGTGVLFNANRREPLPPEWMDPLVAQARRLNRYAAEALAGYEVHAVTDVTGFGLAGHALEMAHGVRFVIEAEALPILPGAVECRARGVTTGATHPNRQSAEPALRLEGALPEELEEMLHDPQTSGGLLVALPAAQGAAALDAIREAGDARAAIVGRVEELPNGDPFRLVIRA